MKKSFRSSLIIFAAICVVGFAVFNILGERLHQVEIKPVPPWMVATVCPAAAGNRRDALH